MTVQDLNQTLADSFGLKRPTARWSRTSRRTAAAAAAGLKAGDVITEVNGEPIVRSGALSSLIGLSTPGERVKLKVWRDQQPARRSRPSSAAPTTTSTQAADAGSGEHGGQLGLALRPLTREERRAGQGRPRAWSSRTSTARRRAPASSAGDVLLAINGKPVQSVDQVKSVLAGKPKSVALLVQRDGEKIFVPVNLS